MKYSNQQLPEGINTSGKHPLKVFFGLLAVMLLSLLAMAFVLGWSGAWLAKLVPFEKEQRLLSSIDIIEGDDSPLQDYLRELADDLVVRMGMQDEFTIKVHFSKESQVNAFATLGGQLVFYKGLLKQIKSENTLAMLLAHELAHVKHRDPIASLGQGLAIETGIGLILGQADLDILKSTGLYTRLAFSRDMEKAADREALTAVHNRYGHLNGALDLYTIMLAEARKSSFQPPEFMRTHPLTQNRMILLEESGREKNWRFTGEKTPLPVDYRQWVSDIR